MDTTTILVIVAAVEGLVGIAVLLTMFWKLAQKDAERARDIQAVREMTEENSKELKQHDEDCKADRRETSERFEEGSKKMAVLANNQEHMQRDLSEMKDDVKTLLKR